MYIYKYLYVSKFNYCLPAFFFHCWFFNSMESNSRASAIVATLTKRNKFVCVCVFFLFNLQYIYIYVQAYTHEATYSCLPKACNRFKCTARRWCLTVTLACCLDQPQLRTPAIQNILGRDAKLVFPQTHTHIVHIKAFFITYFSALFKSLIGFASFMAT